RHHPHATLLVAPPPTSTLFPYTTLFRSVGIQPLTIDSEDFIPDIDSAVPGPGATGYAGHHDTAIVGRRVEAEIRHLPTFIVVDQFVSHWIEVVVVIQWAHGMCSIEDIGYRRAGNLLDQRLELRYFKAALLFDVELVISRL